MKAEKELLRLTEEIVSSFYECCPEKMFPFLSGQFVFIGCHGRACAEGLKEFKNLTQNRFREEAAVIRQAQFCLLTQKGSLHVISGHYCVTPAMADGESGMVPMQCICVWQKTERGFQMLHLHESFQENTPAQELLLYVPFLKDCSLSHVNSEILNYLKRIYSEKSIPSPLSLYDDHRIWHLLYPDQILYVQAANQHCVLHIQNQEILVRSTISSLADRLPGFTRPHRSYLVNPGAVASVKRYQLRLTSGEQIPVSRRRFKALREILNKLPLSGAFAEEKKEMHLLAQEKGLWIFWGGVPALC